MFTPLFQTLDFFMLGLLNRETLDVTYRGKSIADVLAMEVAEAHAFFDAIPGIHRVLQTLVDVGMGYVKLGQSAPTLSGGEAQRVKLSRELCRRSTGKTLYILDEPTTGLHFADIQNLLNVLHRLVDMGNSVVVIEHNLDVIKTADWVIDLGPEGGEAGGQVLAVGTPEQLTESPESHTGRALGDAWARTPAVSKIPGKARVHGRVRTIDVWGARENNLQGVDVSIPRKKMTAISGVSGSGKSSLALDTIYAEGQRRYKVINIDQTPIGHSPRSNPATYVKVFDKIRQLYASLPDAQVRGFLAGHFSFNHKRGRCDACAGLGARCIEMHFLPDVWVQCESYGGKRYNRDVLAVTYKGASIADVLAMRVAEALGHFACVPGIARSLQTLFDVGLGYIKMGQASTTLSGGEAQRVKLARELARPNTGQTVYILDEPTTGLHFADIQKLLDVLNRLVDAGNTAIVVEHNLDVIKTADWVIDLGPEGGDAGGDLIACGTPEDVAAVTASHTGRFLKEVLAGGEMG